MEESNLSTGGHVLFAHYQQGMTDYLAIADTAVFLKEQGKVEAVLPDYAPYVSAKFIPE